jgi:hypothetical protein
VIPENSTISIDTAAPCETLLRPLRGRVVHDTATPAVSLRLAAGYALSCLRHDEIRAVTRVAPRVAPVDTTGAAQRSEALK